MVNHSRHQWVNNNGFTTNHIEKFWDKLKNFVKTPVSNEHLETCLDILMLKQNGNLDEWEFFNFIISLINVNNYNILY